MRLETNKPHPCRPDFNQYYPYNNLISFYNEVFDTRSKIVLK